MTDLQRAKKEFMDKWSEALQAAGSNPEQLMSGTSELIASMDPKHVALLEKVIQAENNVTAPKTIN